VFGSLLRLMYLIYSNKSWRSGARRARAHSASVASGIKTAVVSLLVPVPWVTERWPCRNLGGAESSAI
jgi:hypothetical protein